MNSDCKKIAAFISDYVDKKLGPFEQKIVEDHIAVCYSCQSEVEQTKNLVSRLAGLSSQSVPFDLWPAVADRISERQHKGFMERVLSGFRWKAVALTVPAAAAAVIVLFLRSPQPAPTVSKPSQQVSAEYQAYIQAYSEFRSVQPLSDHAAISAVAELQHEKADKPH